MTLEGLARFEPVFWKTQQFADVPGTNFGRAGTNLGRDGLRKQVAGTRGARGAHPPGTRRQARSGTGGGTGAGSGGGTRARRAHGR